MAKTIIRSGSTILDTYPNHVVLKNTMQGNTDKICIYTEEYIDINKRFFDTQGYDVIKREPELKPCPNPECGETNPLNLYVFPEEDGSCYITCDTCGYNSPYGDTEAEAIRLHNLIAEKAK